MDVNAGIGSGNPAGRNHDRRIDSLNDRLPRDARGAADTVAPVHRTGREPASANETCRSRSFVSSDAVE